MSDARRYAVWPDPRSRSRSRALESLISFHFQNLSPPPLSANNFVSCRKTYCHSCNHTCVCTCVRGDFNRMHHGEHCHLDTTTSQPGNSNHEHVLAFEIIYAFSSPCHSVLKLEMGKNPNPARITVASEAICKWGAQCREAPAEIFF